MNLQVRQDLSQIKVLIIEDNESCRNMLFEQLDPYVSRIWIAGSLKETIKLVEESDLVFDLILLDLGLPDSFGWNTFDRVCNICPKTPILVLTSEVDKDLAVSLFCKGSDGYIVKGLLNIDQLLDTISSIIDRKTKTVTLECTVATRTRDLEKAVSFAYELAKVQNWILNNYIDTTEVDYLIKKFGKIVGANRAYLFEKIEEENQCHYRLLNEWCSPGITSQLRDKKLQITPCFNDYNSPCFWHEVTLTGEPQSQLVKEMVLFDRRVFNTYEALSVLLIPIKDDDQPYGFIGFEDCTQERHWNALEINILRVVGTLISWVLEKIRKDQRVGELSSEVSKVLSDMRSYRRHVEVITQDIENRSQTTEVVEEVSLDGN